MEGMKITCTEKKSTVNVGTVCEVECDTGGPNYASVTCKSAGWRPTNELECEGVNPGVIVGVLIAGIAAVVIIAIGYAKYRQHMKAKTGRNMKVQTGKKSSNSRNRPGKVIGPPTNDDKPKPISYNGSETGSAKSKNSSRKSKPPSYSAVEDESDTKRGHKQSSGGGQDGPEVPPHDEKARRSHHRKQQGGQQYGYNGGYQGYQYADPNQQGSNNQAYYPPTQVGYGYAPQEPAVGYPAMTHPQAYPANRDYHRSYNVPT